MRFVHLSIKNSYTCLPVSARFVVVLPTPLGYSKILIFKPISKPPPMKPLLLLLLSLLMLSQSHAQDPELFKTWYLYSINLEGEPQSYNIWEIEPAIAPTLTITEDLQFHGTAACNTFTGQFSYTDNLLFIENFNRTETTCDFQSHTQFESHYFSFFYENADLQISFLNETSLVLDSPLFQSMQFSSIPLGVPENTLSKTKLYPNPTTDEIFISSENNSIEKCIIYSISGKKILEAINTESSIDVSSLSKGMYFVELISSEGKDVQKFIKK